jgi:DNA-binding XRE family transcriptional regulator
LEIEYSQKDIDRFWSKIDIKDDDDCWNWLKGKGKNGYGQFSVGLKKIGAHQFSYLINNKINKIDDKIFVCHSCDNKLCTNPKHLWLGTSLDNMGDCKLKKRNPIGSKHGNSKILEKDVKKIRIMYSDNKYSVNEIAKQFNVSHATIQRIATGDIWKHVDFPFSKHRYKRIGIELAHKIRELYKSGEYSQKQLCDIYNICSSGISEIINNKVWKEKNEIA